MLVCITWFLLFQGLSYLLTGGVGLEDSLTCSTPLPSARTEVDLLKTFPTSYCGRANYCNFITKVHAYIEAAAVANGLGKYIQA